MLLLLLRAARSNSERGAARVMCGAMILIDDQTCMFLVIRWHHTVYGDFNGLGSLVWAFAQPREGVFGAIVAEEKK